MPSKAARFRSLPAQDLRTEIANAQKELFNLRVRWTTRQLPSRHQIIKVQRDIARMKTVAREGQRSGAR